MARTRSILLNTLAFGLVLGLLATPAQALEERRTFSTERLTVRNLIGEVRVEGHGGSDFEVEMQIQGSGAREGTIRLDATSDELNIIFPDDEEFVYPQMRNRRKADLNMRSEGYRQRVSVRASGNGLELWVDLTVRVPRGAELKLEHGVGEIFAADVEADLELSTRQGNVSVESTYGQLSVATGSGGVDVQHVNGEQINIATGSGNVKAQDFDSERINVATGSGDIELEMARGRKINLATGSGEIEARGVATDQMDVGTGSGSVEIELDQMGTGDFSVGTGSGDISMIVPSGLSADLHAETDGGRVSAELTGAEFRKREKDEVRLTVGGGESRIRLGSGSGDISIRN